MQVGEVDDGLHPVEPLRDRKDVLGAAEVPHAPHHLDPEDDPATLGAEPLTELAKLLDDRPEGLAALALEEEARMDDHGGGSRELGEPGRVVEHAHRAPVLGPAVKVAEEGGNRSVDGEGDAALARTLPERRGEVLVHPEPAREVELAGAEAGRGELRDRILGRVAARQARQTDPNGLHR